MKRSWILHLSLLAILGVSACAPLPQPTATQAQSLPDTETAPAISASEETPEPSPTEAASTEAIPITGHLMTPSEVIPGRVTLTYDVESAGTSAPYGDSYRINRFERPFQQDMTYIPELDILRFEVSEDADWSYVSIVLNGSDLNNELSIHYGVEIDVDADGFGDFIIWASPPYTTQWTTNNVQVFEDTDQDTAGRSSSQAEPGFEGNGYDTLIFEGEQVQSEDPDLAWTRMVEGGQAIVQFAFKESWIGSSFIVGAIADGGLRDLSMFDYNDRLSEADAGSPVRSNSNYPLAALYAVDNTCWQPYGFDELAYQPKFCPPDILPTATRKASSGVDITSTSPPLGSPLPSATDTDSPGIITVPPPIVTVPVPPDTETPPSACDPEVCGGLDYDPITCECIVEDEPTPEP